MEQFNNIDMNNIPPNLMKQARKLASSRTGREILKELESNGINRESIEKTLSSQKAVVQQKSIIIIRPNGAIKSKTVDISDLTDQGPNILHAVNAEHIIYNNESMGDLIVWYDKVNKYTNKKASKFFGYSIGGIVIVYSKDSDIQLKNFMDCFVFKN